MLSLEATLTSTMAKLKSINDEKLKEDINQAITNLQVIHKNI